MSTVTQKEMARPPKHNDSSHNDENKREKPFILTYDKCNVHSR